MSFDAYFRFVSYGFVGTAFVALALTREIDVVSIALYSAAMAASFYADIKETKRFRLREWMWRTMAAGYVPFFFIDSAFISKSRVVALVHLALFASAAKLFQHKQDRDWVFLYLIAFFEMLLAAGLTFSTTFIGSLVLFTFFFVSVLAAFEIRRTRREVMRAGEETIVRSRPQQRGATFKPPRVRYLVSASGLQLAAVATLTLPLFFLIPRFGGSGVVRGFGGGETLTGFSRSVKLGDVAKIKDNSRIAMRVQLDHEPGRWLRWRGVALDHFSGRSWQSTMKSVDREQERILVGEGSDRAVQYQRSYLVWPDDRTDPSQPNLLRQDIILEPLGVGTLFAAPRVVRVRGTMPRLITQESGDISADGVNTRRVYTAFSNIQVPSELELHADSSTFYPADLAAAYVQLPDSQRGELPVDPRVRQLALEVTAGKLSLYEKARAIETYLKQSLTYSLDLKPTQGDPLAEFLFEERRGHCEFFATAMAVMLRTLGIPARVVNGFQMGEYNDISGMHTVRDRDAHSWVEVYFPGLRIWVEFDPTPAAGINDYSGGGFAARLRKYLDAAELFWMDYVVTLDRDEQASIMIGLQRKFTGVREHVTEYYQLAKHKMLETVRVWLLDREWKRSDLWWIAAAIAAIAAIAALSSGRRRGNPAAGYMSWWSRLFILPGWKSRHDRRESAILFYEQMLATVSRAGLIKMPYETPAEFAGACSLATVGEITEIYHRVRFGGATLSDQEASRVTELLSCLKNDIRRARQLHRSKTNSNSSLQK